jgi:EmrB/QacA subfamily drug resistance transporter
MKEICAVSGHQELGVSLSRKTTENLKNTKNKDILLVAVITAGAFVTMFNQTTMTPALPSIMRDLHIDASVGQWLTTIFMLVSGIMVPVTAYLINRFSTRQLFLLALLVFFLGTLACGFAPSFLSLLGGRVLQAIGAGVLMPFSAVTIMLVFPKERRGLALGVNGIVIGVGPAVGPTVSGLIVDTLGWRYIFYLIAPLAAIVILVAVFRLRNLGNDEKTSLDWPSVVLSTIAFGGLLFGFSMAGTVGWAGSLTVGPVMAGTVVLIFYVRRQLRLETPVLKLSVLSNKIFATSTMLTMILQTGMTVGMVITPIYLQNALGETALVSGLTVLPAAVLMCVLSPFIGVMFDKYGPRTMVIVGLVLSTSGTALLSIVSTETSLIYITVVYTFRMAGMGFVNMPLTTWGINALANDDIAHGNAIVGTARMVSASLGTAILITIMVSVQNAHMDLGEAAALAQGVDIAFAVAAGTMAVAFVAALLKVRKS